jgi:hypothetical protein
MTFLDGVTQTPSGHLHIYPLDEPHQLDGAECWCKPNTFEYGIIVHNSMDAREEYERGERKPS